VDPVTFSITIARPREQVFEYLADIANHAEFTDHYIVDWRLTREDTYGRGAGARYKVKMPLNRFPWGESTTGARASTTGSAPSASTPWIRGRATRPA
jgi:hypothetical protein